MTETLMGYKGKTGVTNEEREEYKILNQIFVNVNSDILGEVLLERFSQLGNLLPDAAMFYAPYVPLMSYVPLKSTYGRPVGNNIWISTCPLDDNVAVDNTITNGWVA